MAQERTTGPDELAAGLPGSQDPSGRRALRWLGLTAGLLLASFAVAVTLILPEPETTPIPAHLVLPPGTDAWSAGQTAYADGDLESAAAYWRQVPEGSPDWACAQRFIGWKLHVQEAGQPGKALPYVHRSVLADPTSGNAWHDLGRTYAAALGFGERGRARVPSGP